MPRGRAGVWWLGEAQEGATLGFVLSVSDVNSASPTHSHPAIGGMISRACLPPCSLGSDGRSGRRQEKPWDVSLSHGSGRLGRRSVWWMCLDVSRGDANS